MGMFSWNCKCCGHPALSPEATNEKNRWMSNVVFVESDGSILIGEYDGYGRVNGRESDGTPDVYHKACWKLAGRPSDYKGGSKSALDQGWFFDDEDHDMAEPKSVEDFHSCPNPDFNVILGPHHYGFEKHEGNWVEHQGRWRCKYCGYPLSAMVPDNEVENCVCACREEAKGYEQKDG